MRRFFKQADQYFLENQQDILIQDWKKLRPMTILYMGALAFYYFAGCLPTPNGLQREGVILALLVQAVYSLVVWTRPGPPKTRAGMGGCLLLFGSLIVALAVWMETIVFQDRACLLPLVLILMTQIYTMHPKEVFAGLSVYTSVFLLLDFRMKSPGIFGADVVTVILALLIAVSAYVTAIQSKIQAAEREKELKRMCSVDAMTGMLNKSAFIHAYSGFLRETGACRPYGLAVVDIDHFKSINDRYGHIVGDEVIHSLAAVFHRRFSQPEREILGRFGGDEFLVLLKDAGDTQALEELFRGLLEESSNRIRDTFGFEITYSAGIALQDEGEVAFAKLFLAADRGLYQAKEQGGGAVILTKGQAVVDEPPLFLCVNLHPSDRRTVQSLCCPAYRLLEADGTFDTVNILERYGENISLLFVDIDAQRTAEEGIVTEVRRIVSLTRLPVVVLSEGGTCPGSWSAMASAAIRKPVDERSLRETLAVIGFPGKKA